MYQVSQALGLQAVAEMYIACECKAVVPYRTPACIQVCSSLVVLLSVCWGVRLLTEGEVLRRFCTIYCFSSNPFFVCLS